MEQENGNAPADEPRALSDIFTRREAPEQVAEPAGQPEPQPAPQPEPQTGEQTTAAPAEPKTPEAGLTAALQAERKKRQAYEKELAELRAKLTAQPAPPAHQPQPPPEPQVQLSELMFQDPDRFVQTLQQRQEEAMLATRIATSEAMARQQPDYDAAEQALSAYAQTSPAAAAEVARMLRTHPAPAMWAYQAGKHILSLQKWQPLMQQHADPDAYINAEIERRMSERQAQQPTSPEPTPPARLPTSLAGARNTAPRSGPAWSGPRPLNAILGQRR